MSDIKKIIDTFSITQTVLEERESISHYINSLSNLIIDRYYNYLLLNEQFNAAIHKQQIPLLKKAS